MVTNDSKINNARVMTMFMAIRNFELKNVPASATVMLDNQMTIKPFRHKKNPQQYKEIVSNAEWQDIEQVKW